MREIGYIRTLLEINTYYVIVLTYEAIGVFLTLMSLIHISITLKIAK